MFKAAWLLETAPNYGAIVERIHARFERRLRSPGQAQLDSSVNGRTVGLDRSYLAYVEREDRNISLASLELIALRALAYLCGSCRGPVDHSRCLGIGSQCCHDMQLQ